MEYRIVPYHYHFALLRSSFLWLFRYLLISVCTQETNIYPFSYLMGCHVLVWRLYHINILLRSTGVRYVNMQTTGRKRNIWRIKSNFKQDTSCNTFSGTALRHVSGEVTFVYRVYMYFCAQLVTRIHTPQLILCVLSIATPLLGLLGTWPSRRSDWKTVIWQTLQRFKPLAMSPAAGLKNIYFLYMR